MFGVVRRGSERLVSNGLSLMVFGTVCFNKIICMFYSIEPDAGELTQ